MYEMGNIIAWGIFGALHSGFESLFFLEIHGIPSLKNLPMTSSAIVCDFVVDVHECVEFGCI